MRAHVGKTEHTQTGLPSGIIQGSASMQQALLARRDGRGYVNRLGGTRCRKASRRVSGLVCIMLFDVVFMCDLSQI